MRPLLVVACFSIISAVRCSSADTRPLLACDRELRKTFESIQAWRRQHNGRYPDRLADLQAEGLGICPAFHAELANASPAHSLATSRGEGRDPARAYEYEMSAVSKSKDFGPWLPYNSAPFTRGELKAELLRREHWEQVPILRCFTHRDPEFVPTQFAGEGTVARNLTASGNVYWSGMYWEQQWLDTVPYCCRQANVLFGLEGPPFHTDREPDLATALDLRQWNSAFGDYAWWWEVPMFEEDPNRHYAANLSPFFQGHHGRALTLGQSRWWIDGLVQLQGQVLAGHPNRYRAASFQAFVWERTGLKVGRTIRGASWLQGTVWPAAAGEVAGWLVWNYSHGPSVRVPIVYGTNTARFWAAAGEQRQEVGFAEPAWKHEELAKTVGRDRWLHHWLRLYQQTWVNPRPNVTVTSLDFVSNTNSTAAPFLIAVNVLP